MPRGGYASLAVSSSAHPAASSLYASDSQDQVVRRHPRVTDLTDELGAGRNRIPARRMLPSPYRRPRHNLFPPHLARFLRGSRRSCGLRPGGTSSLRLYIGLPLPLYRIGSTMTQGNRSREREEVCRRHEQSVGARINSRRSWCSAVGSARTVGKHLCATILGTFCRYRVRPCSYIA